MEGRRNLELKRTTTKEDINHAVCWLNDIVFIYIKQNNMSKKTIQLEVHFPELLNLKCLSHNIGCEYTYLEPFADCVVIVFEKIDLTAATRLGKYTLESF